MLIDFIREATEEMDTTALHAASTERRIEKGEGAIRIRKERVPKPPSPTSDIYDRARMIYSRARRPNMARAAGIF